MLFDKIRQSHFLRHLSWCGKCNGQRFEFDKILHCLRSLYFLFKYAAKEKSDKKILFVIVILKDMKINRKYVN